MKIRLIWPHRKLSCRFAAPRPMKSDRPLLDKGGLQTSCPRERASSLPSGGTVAPARTECQAAAGHSPSPPTPGAVKKFHGRDALPRVRNRKPKADAEHRVPTRTRPYAQWNFFTAPLSRAGERGADTLLRTGT